MSLSPDGASPQDVAGPTTPHITVPVEALGLESVRHSYGRTLAVDGVSLTIGVGEIVCLVGPSGCGKSTLLRVAAGLELVQQGAVRIAGRMVADAHHHLPPEKRGIGLVFQDYALFPHLSVLDNVRFGLVGMSGAAQRQRAEETLAQVGMRDYTSAYPHALSGGQQQRVALARALAPNPAVLLLDEPFSGLDARLRGQIRDETLHVLKRNGAATMLVTHDPEEAMFLADRIVLMRDGRVEQSGTPVELYTAPQSAFATTFFGEANRLRGTVAGQTVVTPLGRLSVAGAGLVEGQAVEVLIRPEALHLSAPSASVLSGSGLPLMARVMAARLLGRSSLVHLSLPVSEIGRNEATENEATETAGARTLHLHARMPGQFLPTEDSMVALTLDPRQTFVFPDRRESGQG